MITSSFEVVASQLAPVPTLRLENLADVSLTASGPLAVPRRMIFKWRIQLLD